MWLRSIWLFILRAGRRLDRYKSLWFRAVLGLSAGLAVLSIDMDRSQDTRFALRPPQSITDRIVLVTVTEREWTSLFPNQRNVIRPLKEITSLTDSFFWHEETIETLLEQTLSLDPEVIGVTFYFGDNLENLERVRRRGGVWTADKVVWSADADSTGRILYPAFADTYASNVGLSEYRTDVDTVVRSFVSRLDQVDHISWKLAHRLVHNLEPATSDKYGRISINFRGPSRTFPHYRLVDVLRGQVPPNVFKGKIVIVGAEDTPGHKYLTPVGTLSKAELIANTVNNWIDNQWVRRTRFLVYALYLLAILLLEVWILRAFPQAMAILGVGLLGLGVAALSAYAFDAYNFWLPVRAPLVTLTGLYILFLSFELALREKQTWRLEQEKRYITEIEQMKHNFVSLISHDLKTPIARIQGVVDRLLAAQNYPDLANDLNSIRLSSVDLHRYIQTILQLSKVESRDLKVMTQVVDINELIEQVTNQLQGLANDKHLRIKTTLEPMFSVELDPTLIREVLVNCLENAIKYTQEGGEIHVTSEEKDDTVRITVSDNGPGIPLEEQTRIWDKFYRGRDVALKTKGTGLGMYLVKYFVELHKGHVFLKSTPGLGTTVGFSLPLSSGS